MQSEPGRFNEFIINIQKYYDQNKRALPWRKSPPVPYEIWLSEVIMQQTRIAQGTPYFEKILAAFPTPQALADAPEDELLALWTGLGYYNRARNLQKGARQVVDRFGGELPTTYEELLSITGIGPYTAAAISSICFSQRVGVVDGNVYRVLSRYFGWDTPINSTLGQRQFQALANELIAQVERPGDYNQGLMEFGALHCTPQKPLCTFCPLIESCEAYATHKVNELPVKIKKGKRGETHLHYQVVQNSQGLAMVKRGNDGIWAGLYEFPTLPSPPAHGKLLEPPTLHKLSHKDLHCHFWGVAPEQLLVEDQSCVYLDREALHTVGIPAVIRDFVERNL